MEPLDSTPKKPEAVKVAHVGKPFDLAALYKQALKYKQEWEAANPHPEEKPDRFAAFDEWVVPPEEK
jgi:hypothetical protein